MKIVEKLEEVSSSIKKAQDWIAENTTTVYFASIGGIAASMLAYAEMGVDPAKYLIIIFGLGIVYAKNVEDSRSRGRYGEDTRKRKNSSDRDIEIG